MNNWLDITIPMGAKGLTCWPGDICFTKTPKDVIGVNGSACNTSLLQMTSHSGTHVDAQKHFVKDGKNIMDIPFDRLIGRVYVADCRDIKGDICADVLKERVPEGVTRLLIRSSNEDFLLDGVFHADYSAPDESGMNYLIEKGIFFFGIDYFSAAPMSNIIKLHQDYLAVDGNVFLENITLKGIEPGWYDMICLPMAIEEGDGAPARTLLKKAEE